jgi:glucose/mannose-6-phosphate isomerase
MTFLDQPDRWKPIDPKSMYLLVDSWPEQIEEAARNARAKELPDGRNAGAIVVTGLGGSAIGGDLAKAVAGPDLVIPMIVNRDYNLPAFVNRSSLVIACSYSGSTEETLSAYGDARRAGASIVCITSGGRLVEMARADSVPVLGLPGGLPPRAALGHSLVTLLVALQNMRIIADAGEAIKEAAALLRRLREKYGVSSPQSRNIAKIWASSLAGKIVAIYGSSGIMEAVAFRWRTQIEENAKNLAFHQSLPEMNHNELVGWVYPEEALRRVGVVLLRDRGDHPQVKRRFELTAGIVAGKAGALHEIWSEGDSLLARVLSMISLGDYVSLYMAYLNGVDPTPVEVIDYLKKSLGAPKQPDTFGIS